MSDTRMSQFQVRNVKAAVDSAQKRKNHKLTSFQNQEPSEFTQQNRMLSSSKKVTFPEFLIIIMLVVIGLYIFAQIFK